MNDSRKVKNVPVQIMALVQLTNLKVVLAVEDRLRVILIIVQR